MIELITWMSCFCSFWNQNKITIRGKLWKLVLMKLLAIFSWDEIILLNVVTRLKTVHYKVLVTVQECLWSSSFCLDHSAHFEESLEVVDLSQSHGHQHQSLEEWPHDHSAVGVLIDCSVDPVSHLQEDISWKRSEDVTKCVFTCMYSCSCLTPVRAVLSSLIISSSLLWLGSSSPSLVASLGASPMSMLNMTIFGVMVDIWLEKQYWYTPSMWAAKVYLPLDSLSPCPENVKAKFQWDIFELYLVDGFAIWTHNSDIDIKKSSLGHLKHQTHLGARLNFVKETFFCVCINCDEIGPGCGHEICQN